MSLAEVTQWATPSLGGVAAIFFLLVATGRLVPLSTLKRELAAETRRADNLEAALKATNERADLLVSQQERLLRYAETTDAVLRALPRPRQQVELPSAHQESP